MALHLCYCLYRFLLSLAFDERYIESLRPQGLSIFMNLEFPLKFTLICCESFPRVQNNLVGTIIRN